MITSKWLGESEKAIAALFQIAREFHPSIIFIDEVDSVCGDRNAENESATSLRVKAKLLTELDGVDSDIDGKRVIVIGTTNVPAKLDGAFLRRFPKRVHVGLPGKKDRQKIIENELKNYMHKIKPRGLKFIARNTEKYLKFIKIIYS